MKLAEHVENIRKLIDKSYRNRLGRIGITLQWATSNLQDAVESKTLTDCKLPNGITNIDDLRRIIDILSTFEKETGTVNDAYEKLVEELTFTLFNRIAAMKVMEAHTLHPEIITHRSQHGDRSFAHFLWLEQNPDGRNEENEGLVRFFEDQLTILSTDIPLFNTSHPYHLLPTAIELHGIINAFNQVENDDQVETDIWQSDDVLGWLYESYNNYKKAAHKESGAKTEYNKVSIQSQVYTPRWVVKFLVDNSLGKLYLEMFPDSAIKEKYKIANTPKTQTRNRKPLTEIRMIDLATGSGNFVLYGFDLFCDMYLDQIENYGADYNENKLPELIIKNNLYGIDLDDRAVQLAQLGLYIKAKRVKRTAKIDQFNIVSSDFFLPEYRVVKELFYEDEPLSPELEQIVIDLWSDLQQAHKFGSLIRLEEKFQARLHVLVQQFEKDQLQLFSSQTLASYEQFRDNFFSNLKKAVNQNAAKQGMTILNNKTQDAITFLQILTQKYDVAVSNPPYTDSADFGTELKRFIDTNYRQPYKFNSNLYAAFIKRCYEMVDESGYVALIHPHTFMFIKTFEDVRKFMIEHTHIDILVDYGLDRVNLFGTNILLDATWYVLCKKKKSDDGVYFNIIANQQEKYKQSSLAQAYEDYLNNKKNDRVFNLAQSKLKIIEGFPFIYWISDRFREKFKTKNLKSEADIMAGIQTSNNFRFLRYWWEISKSKIFFSIEENLYEKYWVPYSKGGKFNKWYGNIWLVINWKENGSELQTFLKANNQDLHAQAFYFKGGITYSYSGSKDPSFRILDNNVLFDIIGSSIFPITPNNLYWILSVLNSKLSLYILGCLNPTAATQVGDIKRIPFVDSDTEIKKTIEVLALQNIKVKQALNSFKLTELNYIRNPLLVFNDQTLKFRLLSFLQHEIEQLSIVLLSEALIDKFVFDTYGLNLEDRHQVEVKYGKSVGSLALHQSAKESFLEKCQIDNEDIMVFFKDLPTQEFTEKQIQTVKAEFVLLYQSNNDIEEFCIRLQINPINVWYWFTESNNLPQGRAHEIALEFIADACRAMLMVDDDGIIPLVGLPNEPKLIERLEHYCLQNGFTSAQFMQLDGLLGNSLNEYLEHHFFKDFSDHLNLFPNLPKTPFIWHLSSGEHQGFEAYIIIYKWNRDSLFKLKTQYLNKRVENLEYRQIQLQDSISAQAQTEKELIHRQINEIAEFTRKVEELIAEGYDPKLDDGVGKNIAPLQKKGLLQCEVLNKKQLEKYLNADW
ncbi:MAG: BREX-1 system adenine-specific DNA-methyltransferase PglX [Bacteroidales bacterium]